MKSFTRKVGLLIASSLFGASIANAEITDNHAWAAVATNGSFKKDGKLLYWFDGHARYGDDASDLQTTIFRPAIGWKLENNIKLFAGYARVTGHRVGANIEEDRFWQQAITPLGTIAGGNLSSRSRFEFRFRDDLGNDTGYRFRQMLLWSKESSIDNLSFVISDEIFIPSNDTDWGQRSGFDQNRAFFGISYKINPSATISPGYMHNYINRPAGENQINHVLSTNLIWKF